MQQDEEEINTYHCDKEGYFWEDEPDSADILSDKSSHKNSYEINSDWSINPPYDQESIMEEMEASNIEVIETVDEEIIQQIIAFVAELQNRQKEGKQGQSTGLDKKFKVTIKSMPFPVKTRERKVTTQKQPKIMKKNKQAQTVNLFFEDGTSEPQNYNDIIQQLLAEIVEKPS